MSGYPTKRNLDGAYFRVRRGMGYEAVCWTDLTDEEREEQSKGRAVSWWVSLAEHLTQRLRYVGDELDIEFVEAE